MVLNESELIMAHVRAELSTMDLGERFGFSMQVSLIM